MFSIVMPVWNKRRFLEATVASVLAQEWTDFELIVVEDGSTDGSLDLLGQLRDPRIRLLVQANAGPGPARNAGIEAANHDWIAFLDADDLWLPCHLAELDRIRARYRHAGLIGTPYYEIRSGRRILRDDGRPGRIATIDYLSALASGTTTFGTSSCAIHRQVYRDLGGFGSYPCAQDVEYWARIALDRVIAMSDRRTAIYVLGTGGITDSVTLRRRDLPIRGAHDLSPVAAMLVDRAAKQQAVARQRSIDSCIEAEFRICARNSARIGDIDTLRSLRAFYPRKPGVLDRLLFAIARLPRPLARALCRVGFPIWRAFRPLRQRRRFRALIREQGFGADARPVRADG